MVVHTQSKVLASCVMHISYPCIIFQGTAAPKYEPQHHKHAKSPMAYHGHIGIQSTLAIWAHKRHCYTENTSMCASTMVYEYIYVHGKIYTITKIIGYNILT